MKKITLCFLTLSLFTGCAELQNVVNNLPTGNTNPSTPTTPTSSNTGGGILSNLDISNGLKEALESGVSSGVDLLSKQNGYYNNSLAKILLPAELQKVDNTLRKFGMGTLADEGIKLLNRAAENAVSQAKPIFVSAIKNLTFADATAILTGEKNAATQYLQRNTTSQLVSAFSPEIKKSLDQVGANKIWSQIMTKYNTLPLVTPVNADLTNYVTEKAVQGLFAQIAEKETEIRQNVNARTTPLLQKVFSKQ